MFDSNGNYRRPVLQPSAARIRAAFVEMLADLHEQRERHIEQHAEFLREAAAIKAEVAELRDVLLLVTSITRERAEKDVTELYRILELAIARLERKPDQVLH